MSMVRKDTGEVHMRLVLVVLFRVELGPLHYVDPIVRRGHPYEFAEVLWERAPDDADHMAHNGLFRAAIVKQHPALGQIDVKTVTIETFEMWLAAQIERFGEYIAFQQISDRPNKRSKRDKFLGGLYENTLRIMLKLQEAGLLAEGRRGGMLAVFHTSHQIDPLFKMMVGEMPTTQISNHWDLVEGKCRRLLARVHEDYRFSSQVTYDDWQQYAGAVLTDDGYVVAFSGLLPLDNEALVLLIAVAGGVMSKDRATELAQLANNTRYSEFESYLG